MSERPRNVAERLAVHADLLGVIDDAQHASSRVVALTVAEKSVYDAPVTNPTLSKRIAAATPPTTSPAPGRRRVWTIIVACTIARLLLAAPVVPAAGSTDLLLVLDASGSMWGRVAGEPKIAIARRVLKDLAGKVPADTAVGLIAYGHRREADCDDIATVLPIGPLDVATLAATVDGLNAKGKTPITKALQQAIGAVKARDTVATVVLVSDGIETCGGDPCATVRAAKDAGVKLVLHVVGFDVGEVDVSQLECTAQAGGGLYFDARNAADLAAAFDQVLEAPAADVPASRLVVKVTEGGKAIDATVVVTASGSPDVVARGRTYVGPETNPRVFPLEPGRYDVAVTHLGLAGDAERRIAEVEVRPGETTERTVDFGVGRLAVKATRDGALEDCSVQVYRAGTEEQIASGRTYTAASSNPQVFALGPGSYDVSVQSVRVEGGTPQRIAGVEVRPGETATREVDFSAGTLAIGVTRNGKLSDATVTVHPTGAKEQAAAGRTYVSASSNPRRFELASGTYDVRVRALEIADAPEATYTGVVVRPGEPAERAHDFPSGTLTTHATHAGAGWDATVAVRRAGTRESVAGGRTYGRPKAFELSPGEYEVEMRPLALEGGRAKSVTVAVSRGVAAEAVVTFP